MKLILGLVATALFISEASFAAQKRCAPSSETKNVVHINDYPANQTFEQMTKSFEGLYASGRRLLRPAYYDEASGSYVAEARGKLARLDPIFIKSITRHIEISLERKYADFVFFSDMGHSHLQIPNAEYEKIKGIMEKAEFYEKVFSVRSLKILYHTAEQLRGGAEYWKAGELDPAQLWRYFSRNPIGDNNGGENIAPFFAHGERYNTVRDLPGHRFYAGFYISASKDGCFPYQHNGKTYYFDLTLEELPYDSGGSYGGEYGY